MARAPTSPFCQRQKGQVSMKSSRERRRRVAVIFQVRRLSLGILSNRNPAENCFRLHYVYEKINQQALPQNCLMNY
jgi:hypothetical protein